MAGPRSVLLLPVRGALGPGGDDPQLGESFGLSAAGLAGLIGLFYYGYSPFSLVAGVAMDQLGARLAVPIGAAAMGVGALLFATGNPTLAALADSLREPAACLR